MLKPTDNGHSTGLRWARNAHEPVAVVAGIDLNGLGIVRSLAAERVQTLVLDTDFLKATAATRFGRKIKIPALSGPAFIAALRVIAEKLTQKPVLFLTQEGSVETVSAAHDEIADCYRFTMPRHEVMQALLSKGGFQKLAEELHGAIPRSTRLNKDTTSEAMSALRFPCVIKPMIKDDAYSAKFKKAYMVASFDQFDQLWRKMRDTAGEMIVQEWIEGADSDVYFCLQYRSSSSPAISFVGRKICQWPPLVGGTASCVPAPSVRDELVEMTDAFFQRVGFVGLGSMEYKRDARDGRFYMVEPTVGRTDYQEEVATLNGVNIPYAAYCGEIGRPFHPAGSTGPLRIWRDSASYWKALAAGAVDRASEIAPDADIIDAVYRLNDPSPYLFMKMEPVQRRSRRWFNRRDSMR